MLDGIGLLVGARVYIQDDLDNSTVDTIPITNLSSLSNLNYHTLHYLQTSYREEMDVDPTGTINWGFYPIFGYFNENGEYPAISRLPDSWPTAGWPSVNGNIWAGEWNGRFGRGVTYADLETYFVVNDAHDLEYLGEDDLVKYYPRYSSKKIGEDISIQSGEPWGGLGLRVETRGFQWNNPQARDAIFWEYNISNTSKYDLPEVCFGYWVDNAIGGDAADDEVGYFNDLLDNYNTNLLDNLRGFGNNEEYLKFYVPGTSSIKSFYNLIDAFVECQQLEFVIFYKQDSFEKKLIDEMNIFLKKISINKEIIKNNFTNLEIKIDKILYKNFINQIKPKIKEIGLSNIKQNKINAKDKILVFKSEKKIEQSYLNNIHKIVTNNYFSKKIIDHENLFLGKIDGSEVKFIVENKIITQAFHDCENNKTLKKLLDIFFDICINKNIQEAAEHSVIYLEEKIRIENDQLIKSGIILPSHAGTYFDNLNLIIRQVFNEFVKKNEIKFGINKNYFKKSYHWINLSEEAKIQKIDLVLNEISQKHGLINQSIIVQSIDSNFKVNLGVDKNFKDLQLKKNILLEIEIKIKKLDVTLEVFIDEVLDKNKLRLKNSPQTKLLK